MKMLCLVDLVDLPALVGPGQHCGLHAAALRTEQVPDAETALVEAACDGHTRDP